MKFTNKTIYPIIITIAGIILLSACQENTEELDSMAQEQRFFDLYVGANYPDVQPRTNGLYFLEHKEGTGSFPDSDDWLLVNHVCYRIPTNTIFESYIENVVKDNQTSLDRDSVAIYGPYKMLNGSRTPGLTEGLTLMREGGQATIFFTSELGYGTEGTGSITGYQSLKYEVELLKVIKDIDIYEQEKVDFYLDTVPEYDTIHDDETDAFMYYIINESTDGKQVATDSLVTVAYKGYLMDGRVFDERTASDAVEFKVARDEFAARWDLVLPRLHVGEKATFIFPYQMGYGEAGNVINGVRTIPPYETLLFDVEIISMEADPADIKESEK